MEIFDIAVIGGGAGGLVVASGAAQLGARVALIEKEPVLGGDCLHFGCVPTKTLIHSAKIFSLMVRAKEFGLSSNPSFDFQAVMEHVGKVIGALGVHDDPERFEKMGVRIFFGQSSFLDRSSLQISGRTIRSKRFVVATGSRPMAPSLAGLDKVSYLNNVSALQLRRLPRSLIVLGAGPVGIEFAQAFRRFGSEVTLIEKENRILIKEDEEVAAELADLLKSEGIRIMTSVEVNEVRESGKEKIIVARDPSGDHLLRAEEILVGIGRTPNVEGLNLEGIGVAFNPRGVVVDSTMRTTVKNIWACGDVTGLFPFTHVAEYQAGLVVSNSLFPLVRRKADYRVVPWVTFSDPELARVGLTEREAREQYSGVQVYRYFFKDVDRAVIEGEGKGMVKLVCDSKQKILGATLLGPHAGDLIHEFVLAMKANLKMTLLSGTIHAYPTLAQAVKRTADRYYREKLFKGWFPKLSKFLIKIKKT